MDGNYEAQRQLARQRLVARREQAAAERLLRQGRPPRMHALKQFLATLFRRSGRQDAEKGERQASPARLATTGKSKG